MHNTSRLTRFARIILPLLSIGVVGYMGSVLLDTSHAAELGQAGTQQTAAPAARQLPTTLSGGCCEVSVTSARRHSPDSTRYTVSVRLVNQTKQTIQISPGLQTELQDTAGTSYPYTASYLGNGQTTGGPLVGGAERTENFDYDVPLTAIAQSISFQQDASATVLKIGLPL